MYSCVSTGPLSSTRGLPVSSLSALRYTRAPPLPASTSAQPILLDLSALAHSYPNPASVFTFSQLIILAPSVFAHSNPNLASVSLEAACHLAPASATCASARTSGLSAPQLASAQIQPAPDTRSLIVPAPDYSDPIAHLAIITGAVISSVPYIDTLIKGCQFQTVAVPPPSTQHLATSLLQSLTSSRFPATVGKP